jgi:arylsulfatase A-like enzyme
VVLIMTDDHGAWSLGCYGNTEAHTPNIDALAASGLRFTNAFAAAAVCSPSRMTYMTGKMPCQHGVQDYIVAAESRGKQRGRFLDGHTTYSELLAGQGYTLGMYGKWHMGDDARPQKGFKHWLTIAGAPYRDPTFFRGGEEVQLRGYKTDLITDEALHFIERNQDGPFFLKVSYNAPHTPYDFQPEEYRRPYLDSSFPAFPQDAPHPNQIRVYRQHLGKAETRLSYMALVRGVDQNTGRILRALERFGLRRNTLVIFCADQGFNCGHHGVWGKGNGTLPFNMYEETIRIPFIWSLPGAIPAAESDAMVSTYDFLPTLLDFVGAAGPADHSLAGRSFAGLLRTGGQAAWRSDRVFVEYAYARGIRTRRFKYVRKGDGHADEFYDLEADPLERRNMASDANHAGNAARFRDELDTWFAQRGAPAIDEWRASARNTLDPAHYARQQGTTE